MNHFFLFSNAPEVIYGLNYFIYIENFIFYTDGIGFKNISGLIVSQTAAFNMIVMVCQLMQA